MSSSLTYTYGLIKALYDQGHDYLDAFWPFALLSFPAQKQVDSEFVQKYLIKSHNLKIPLHVVEFILKRAVKRGVLEKGSQRGKFIITEKGSEHLESFETEKDVERRINYLLDDLLSFFLENDVSINHKELHELVLSFIQNNLEPLIAFLNLQMEFTLDDCTILNRHEHLLIEYIMHANLRRPEQCSTLQDMVLGSLISVLVYREDVSLMIDIKDMKFKNLKVLLDTNYIFSLMGFHGNVEKSAAIELLEIMNNAGFDLKVFNFTVDEICRVINDYEKLCGSYTESILVDSIYSTLKILGWGKSDAKEFISNIEDKLEKYNITIEWSEISDLKNYEPDDLEHKTTITRYKQDRTKLNYNHDLAAIDQIKKIRRRSFRKIEDSKAIFITSDYKLFLFNLKEMHHKENGTVCEVIHDKMFTNLLWLKNPSLKLPLNHIIATCSKGLFVRRMIWERFHKTVQKMKSEGKVTTENIAMLLYHSQIEETLKQYSEEDKDKINEQFIFEEIQKANKILEATEKEKEEARDELIASGKSELEAAENAAENAAEEAAEEASAEIEIIKKRYQRKEEEYEIARQNEKDELEKKRIAELNEAEKLVNTKIKDVEDTWLDKINTVKSKARETARGRAKKTIIFLRLSSLFIILYLVLSFWNKMGPYGDIVELISIVVAFTLSGITSIWIKLEEACTESEYKQKTAGVRDIT